MNCPHGVRACYRSQRSACARWASSSCPAVTLTPKHFGSTGRAWAKTYTRPVTCRPLQLCIMIMVNPRNCKVPESRMDGNGILGDFSQPAMKQIRLGYMNRLSYYMCFKSTISKCYILPEISCKRMLENGVHLMRFCCIYHLLHLLLLLLYVIHLMQKVI